MPQHPLLFAMHQTNNAYTTAIPSTMLCRSYKVRNYQLIFLWIKITHHRLCSRRHHIDLTATSNAHPTPSFTTSNPPGVLNASTARRGSDMRVRHCFIYMFCLWFDLTLTVLNLPMLRGLTHHTSHTNPIHHPSTSPARRCSAGKEQQQCGGELLWHATLHLQISGYFTHLHFALWNTTTKLYTTTKPHATINLQTSYTKDQRS